MRIAWPARNLDLLFTLPSLKTVRIEARCSGPMEMSALHTIQALAGSLAVRLVHAEELLYHTGDSGDSIYCVLAGEIQLDWPDGGRECFLPGQVFGVGALVEQDHRRHGTARAVRDSEVIEMNREEFLFALQETPMFALQLLASLEERLRRSHG